MIFFAVCKLFYCTSRFYHLPFPNRLLSPFLPVSQPVNCLEKWQQNLNLICEYVEWLLSPCSYSFYFTHMYRCTFVFSIASESLQGSPAFPNQPVGCVICLGFHCGGGRKMVDIFVVIIFKAYSQGIKSVNIYDLLNKL